MKMYIFYISALEKKLHDQLSKTKMKELHLLKIKKKLFKKN